MPETTHVDRIFSLLTQQDEITWQTILYDLVRKEGMDPWDVDISLIARRYIELIRKLKEHDFRLSGKVLLAAAILLKLKSSKLVDEDITELDRLIRGEEEGTS
ncbi:TPA: segregation/condensation protein A, partial [Candidatus Woesearchaeota archaeon]|nr:segregation/condensation protein A [Candidatus Woesearchaeota archaeon]